MLKQGALSFLTTLRELLVGDDTRGGISTVEIYSVYGRSRTVTEIVDPEPRPVVVNSRTTGGRLLTHCSVGEKKHTYVVTVAMPIKGDSHPHPLGDLSHGIRVFEGSWKLTRSTSIELDTLITTSAWDLAAGYINTCVTDRNRQPSIPQVQPFLDSRSVFVQFRLTVPKHRSLSDRTTLDTSLRHVRQCMESALRDVDAIRTALGIVDHIVMSPNVTATPAVGDVLTLVCINNGDANIMAARSPAGALQPVLSLPFGTHGRLGVLEAVQVALTSGAPAITKLLGDDYDDADISPVDRCAEIAA